MDLKRTAREVLENVGGEENIISIMSCFTRVRVELKDKTKVDEKKLKEADGCQGVNWADSKGVRNIKGEVIRPENCSYYGDGSER